MRTALKPLPKDLGSSPWHTLIMRFASRRSTRCRGSPSLNLPTRVLQFVPLLKGTRLCGGRPRTMCRGSAKSRSFCLPVCLDLYYQRGLGIEPQSLGTKVTRSDDPTIGIFGNSGYQIRHQLRLLNFSTTNLFVLEDWKGGISYYIISRIFDS